MGKSLTRRDWLRTAGLAAAALPLCALTRHADGATNAELRAKLAYQDTPKDGLRCTMCLEFVPGKDPAARGGCKVIPGDDEISPNGWCSAFNTM